MSDLYELSGNVFELPSTFNLERKEVAHMFHEARYKSSPHQVLHLTQLVSDLPKSVYLERVTKSGVVAGYRIQNTDDRVYFLIKTSKKEPEVKVALLCDQRGRVKKRSQEFFLGSHPDAILANLRTLCQETLA